MERKCASNTFEVSLADDRAPGSHYFSCSLHPLVSNRPPSTNQSLVDAAGRALAELLLLLTLGFLPHLAIFLLGFLNLALLACRRLSFLPLGLSWCDRSGLGI